jgi:hypothetical protein
MVKEGEAGVMKSELILKEGEVVMAKVKRR